MNLVYLGVDIGSVSAKAAVIDAHNNLLFENYIFTQGDPVGAVRTVLNGLTDALKDKYRIAAVGTTGSARRLAGAMLKAAAVKNEITAHAAGALSLFPDVRTIFEIGGQDSKIILIENGIVSDYAMNTLCAAGTGAFLSGQAARLGTRLESFGALALKSETPARIAARCTVFAESDLVHKIQTGAKKEDIAAGLCNAVAGNFLNNLAKGKKITPPIVFSGGVSQNAGVVQAFARLTGEAVLTHKKARIFGALGAAILAKAAPHNSRYTFILPSARFITRAEECTRCENRCELVHLFQNGKIIDTLGARCE
ncbi:MAG: acyl-CoA dehydratase activase [Firmicutes bacterium]|nr:acyl-CoA dehydratase activase [Bacillota bacterium]